MKNTNAYNFPGTLSVYHGKVRDVYDLGELLVVVASDRISAFDHILPRPIPGKGAVLNLLAAHFLKATAVDVPNWLLAVPHSQVSIGYRCEPIRIEMVVRGYLSGHAAREYASGKRVICGVNMPDGLRESDPFPQPIITPSTKAEAGHDEDISREEILSRKIVSEEVYTTMENYALRLFEIGTQMAASRGLILVDTKYEFGLHKGKVMLMDEIHTPDSSRYFISEGYGERQQNAEPQPQLSKEFVRQWLIANGFQGKEGQTMPVMPDEFVQHVSSKYRELFFRLTGSELPEPQPADTSEIESAVIAWLEKNRPAQEG